MDKAHINADVAKTTRNSVLDLYYNNSEDMSASQEIKLILDEINDMDIPSIAKLEENINEFLYSISSTNRKIFVKRYFYMSSLSDIASECNISESAVRTSLIRSRGELMAYISNGMTPTSRMDEPEASKTIMYMLSSINDDILEECFNGVKDSNGITPDVTTRTIIKPKWYMLIGVVATVVTLILIISLFISQMSVINTQESSTSVKKVELPWFTENVQKKYYEMFGDTSTIDKGWNEKTLAQRYPEFTIGDKEYHYINENIYDYFIADKPMGVMELTTDDVDNKTEIINAEMFSIESISSDLLVAVQIRDSILKNLYINTKYKPRSLGELKEALGVLNKEDDDMYLNYRHLVYYHLDENGNTHEVLFTDSIIWEATKEYILNDDKLNLLYLINIDEELGRKVADLCLSSLYGNNIGITIYDKGYFNIYIYGNEYLFKTDADNIRKYIDYIKENAKGILPNYISAKLDYADKISYLPSIPWPVLDIGIKIIEIPDNEDVTLPWDERPIYDRYNSIVYNDRTYVISETTAPTYSKASYGAELASTYIKGYDPYEDKYYETSVTIYEDGYNYLAATPHTYGSQYALIIYFDEYDEGYYFYNPNYQPETLREFYNNLGIDSFIANEAIYKYMYDEDTEYYLLINDDFCTNNTAELAIDAFKMFDISVAGYEIPAEKITNLDIEPVMTISTSNVKNLNGEPIDIFIYREGYVAYSILGSDIFFAIGKDKVTDYIGTVLDNYFAYIPKYLTITNDN